MGRCLLLHCPVDYGVQPIWGLVGDAKRHNRLASLLARQLWPTLKNKILEGDSSLYDFAYGEN